METVRLVHPDLPGQTAEVVALQATALRKVGWVDAPPEPPVSARSRRRAASAPPDDDLSSAGGEQSTDQVSAGRPDHVKES